MNPFSVAIAQSIAGLPPLSGSGFRIAMWLAFTLIYIAWFIWRAERLRRKADHANQIFRSPISLPLGPFVGRSDLSVSWHGLQVVWAVVSQGYFLREIATQFFVMAIVAMTLGTVLKLNNASLNDYVDAFKTGAAQLFLRL